MRILLVDDQIDVNRSLKEAIEPGGHECFICTDPCEVINKLNQEHYDVIIMDYKMPKMDGLELLKKVRSVSPEVEVIFHSGYLTEDVVVNAASFGAYTIYRKPLNLSLLIKNLDEIQHSVIDGR